MLKWCMKFEPEPAMPLELYHWHTLSSLQNPKSAISLLFIHTAETVRIGTHSVFLFAQAAHATHAQTAAQKEEAGIS